MSTSRLILTTFVLIVFSISAVAFAGDPSNATGELQAVDIQGRVRFEGSSLPEPEGWTRPITVKLFGLKTDSRSNILSDKPVRLIETTTAFDVSTLTATFIVPEVTPGSYNITIQSPGTLVIARRSFVVDGGDVALDMGTFMSGDVNGDGRIAGEDLGIVVGALSSRLGDVGFEGSADVDLNGRIDLTDLTTVAMNFGKTSPQEAELNELMAVSNHAPLDGAVDIGVTVRPQVFFSKPVFPASLSENNFFASFGGLNFPARIVPADDGRFAWLFFDEAMPDASHVQMTIDGSTILPVDGGPALDADGDGEPGGF